MRRRDLILGIGGAMALPLAARAQQKKMPVIGILGVGFPDDPAIALNLAALRQGLKEAGFAEGLNVGIEYRWAYNDQQRLPTLAAELVARRVDVIVTEGGTPSALAAKHATSTIPIVFHSGDAITDGIGGNLARPGGNLTGVSMFAPESLAKLFQLLLEIVPEARMVAALAIPNWSVFAGVRDIEATAREKGVQLQILSAATDSEIEAAYAMLGRSRTAVIVRANATFADQLVRLAARHAITAVYGQRAFVVAGGLISYGVSVPAVYSIKAVYAGKILNGAKAADLPVQQPTRFELLVNLKTAKALGLTVPQSILARADEVIE